MNTDQGAPEAGAANVARDGGRTWQLLALAAAAFLVLGLIGGRAATAANLPRLLAVTLSAGAGLGFVGVSVAMVGLVVRLPLSWQAQLGLTAASGLASAGAKVAGVTLVGDLFLFIAATFFGALVSRLIKERNLVVPVAVVAGAVDTYGVYWGFVAMVAERAPKIVQQLSAAVPGAAVPGMLVPLLSAIGIGDFLFMGLFVGAVHRLGMNMRATLWALFAILVIVPVVFAIIGVPAPVLPGLVFVGIAVLAANWRHFHFSRAEKFALLYATAAVAAVIALAWVVMRMLVG